MALMGSPGSVPVRSVQDMPPSSDRQTRPPPPVVLVAHMRPVPPASAARSLITGLPGRGLASAVSAAQAPELKLVRRTRPSFRPTRTVSGSGTASAVPTPALGYPIRVQVLALSRETYNACIATATVLPLVALPS